MDKPRTLKQTRLNFILLVQVVFLTRQNPWHLEEHDIVDLKSLEKRKAVFAMDNYTKMFPQRIVYQYR